MASGGVECDFQIIDEVDQNFLNDNEESLLALKNLIEERGECNQYSFEDDFLLRFLRARNFVIRHAHRLLVNYFKFKRSNSEYYGDIKIKSIEDNEVICIQPFCDASNRRVVMYKLGNWNPEKHTFEELLKHTILTLELFMLEPRTQILGGVCIIDLDGIKKRHLRFITLKFITQMLDMLLWSFPLRIHAVHIVNDTDATDFDFSIVKLFMNSEAKRRVLSHGDNMQSLHEHLDPQKLPKRYGGSHSKFNYGRWLSNKIRSDDRVLEKLNRIGYNFI